MKENRLFWILFGLLAVSLFVNIGVNPLFLEEPRRAMVALEMYLQNNVFVPKLYGEFYYRKPPFFNWVLLGFMQLFPDWPELACRSVSVISFLLIGWLTYVFCRKFHSEKLGQMASLLFLCSVHLLFYGSLFAEIDLFYSFITFSSFLLLYVFHKQENKLLYFGSIYLLSAVGLLTKGAPSIVFLGLSLLSHLAFSKRLKWLITWQHVASICAFVVVLGLFSWAYSQYNPIQNLIHAVWKQSTDQTVANHGFSRTLMHAIVYPTEVFRDLLPVSLFFPFLFIKKFRTHIWNDDMLRFITILFLVNISVYWLAPGTRSRYVYMLYPLAVILLSSLFLQAAKAYQWVEKWLRGINLFLIGMLGIAFLAFPFFASSIGVKTFSFLYLAISFIALLIIGYYAFGKLQVTQMWWLVSLLILARFQFDLYALPARAEGGEHLYFKIHGEKLAQLTQGEKLWLYKYNTTEDEASLKFGHGFYTEFNRMAVLKSVSDKNCTDFFLTQDFEVENERFELVYTFDYREDRWLLIKFEDCP